MPRYRLHPCEAISYCNRKGASAGPGAPSPISFGRDPPVGIDPSQGTSLSAGGFAEPVGLPHGTTITMHGASVTSFCRRRFAEADVRLCHRHAKVLYALDASPQDLLGKRFDRLPGILFRGGQLPQFLSEKLVADGDNRQVAAHALGELRHDVHGAIPSF